jgi:hypothetical protein
VTSTRGPAGGEILFWIAAILTLGVILAQGAVLLLALGVVLTALVGAILLGIE